MKNDFKLLHATLYAKMWYETFKPKGKRTSIWDDLRVTLKADDYQSEFMNTGDMTTILLNNYCKLDSRYFTDLAFFVQQISERNCWQYGYYTQGQYPLRQGSVPYDMNEAIVYYCLSNLRCMEADKLPPLPKPNFDVLPRRRGISNKTVNEFFPT